MSNLKFTLKLLQIMYLKKKPPLGASTLKICFVSRTPLYINTQTNIKFDNEFIFQLIDGLAKLTSIPFTIMRRKSTAT